MKLSGWLRLWIVVSVLYSGLVIAFVAFTLPNAEDIPHSPSFYDRMSSDLRSKILARDGTHTDPFERQALLDEALRRGIVVKVEMPNKHILVFSSEVPQNEQERTAEAYWTVVTEASQKERGKYIGTAFLWWIIPILGVYALGSAVGWVYRGFRHK